MTVITNPKKGTKVYWMGQGGWPSKLKRMNGRDVTYLGRSGLDSHIISWSENEVEVQHRVPSCQLHSLPLDNGNFPKGSKCLYRDQEWYVIGVIIGEDPDTTRMIAKDPHETDIHRSILFIDMALLSATEDAS